MGALNPCWLFAVLGPFFLILGVVRWGMARRFAPQARTWLLLGLIFSAVAAWLWSTMPAVA